MYTVKKDVEELLQIRLLTKEKKANTKTTLRKKCKFSRAQTNKTKYFLRSVSYSKLNLFSK